LSRKLASLWRRPLTRSIPAVPIERRLWRVVLQREAGQQAFDAERLDRGNTVRLADRDPSSDPRAELAANLGSGVTLRVVQLTPDEALVRHHERDVSIRDQPIPVCKEPQVHWLPTFANDE